VVCDIMVRSYYKDFDWLAYCLASIAKYCVGFRNVILIVPESSRSRLARIRLPALNLRVQTCRNYPDDYLGQQVTKLHADTFTDADYICHVDSDCIFSRFTSPEVLLEDGKVLVVMRPYALISCHTPWRLPTENFLGWKVRYDFMQRQPLTFPRWLYGRLREHCLARHRVDLKRYVIKQPARSFSEYNTLGAYAYELHRDGFTWIDSSRRDPGEPFCRWYWSWGGIKPWVRDQIEELLA